MENHSYYTERIAYCTKEFERANRIYRLFGTLRLLTFILIGVLTYVLWGSFYMFPVDALVFALFLYLVHRSVDAKYKRDKQQKLIEINIQELNVLNGNWHHFKEGNEYKDSQHAFAHDMDIFGKKSIYQLFNRTVSKKGSDLLAYQLKYGCENIDLANNAITDFSAEPGWCQEFLAEGMVFSEGELTKEFQKISEIEGKQSFFTAIIRFGVPIVSILLTVLYSLDIISQTFYLIYIAGIFTLIGSNLKKANSITQQVTSYASQVKMYQRQLILFQKITLPSDFTKGFRDSLFSGKGSLMDSLEELEKIQGRMDFRMNLLVGTLLNFFLAWDFQVIHQWEKWRIKNQSQLGSWENHLAQLEVWISGAVYKFNFPETVFANITNNDSINIKGLGHPFVMQQKRVLNDVVMSKSENFLIITGPNMAGKSTYLRSLGLAIICANAGFPVLAEKCEISEFKLYSSMRTSDDLTVESSYFHAELSRLRFIMDAIEKGEKVFVILDEILKGTNSKDKEIGSAKFLQKLERLNTKGIIATHDLSLCKLAEDNAAYRNMYFDSIISGSELSFDYKIRAGICQNMNASFLLKQMNLVD